MSCRMLIPRSGVVYFLYFLVIAGLLAAVLRLYYLPPVIEGDVSAESMAFLDIAASGSLFQWFVSIVWLLTAGISFLLVGFSGSLRGGGLKSIFWFCTGLVALTMSADAVCSFLPFFGQIAEQKINEYSGDETSFSMTIWILGVIGFVFVLSEVCFLWRYIRSMYGFRLILKFFFTFAAAALLFSILFHYFIPSASPADTNGQRVVSERIQNSKPDEKSAAPKKSNEPNGDKKDDERTANGDFRYVAYETPDETEWIERWEDLFGWENSAEENLGLHISIEDIFGIEEPIENIIFGKEMKLDLLRTRELLRAGAYGIFLVFFSTGLALLARAERMIFDKNIQFGRMQYLCRQDHAIANEF